MHVASIAGLWGCGMRGLASWARPMCTDVDIAPRPRFSVVLLTYGLRLISSPLSRAVCRLVPRACVFWAWACTQMSSKYSKGMMTGPYNPRPRLIDPKAVPAARKGLSAPWAVWSMRSPPPLARMTARSHVRVYAHAQLRAQIELSCRNESQRHTT